MYNIDYIFVSKKTSYKDLFSLGLDILGKKYSLK